MRYGLFRIGTSCYRGRMLNKSITSKINVNIRMRHLSSSLNEENPEGGKKDDENKKKRPLHPLERLAVSYINDTWEKYPVEAVSSFLVTEMAILGMTYSMVILSGWTPSAELAVAFGISRTLRRLRLPLDLYTARIISIYVPSLSSLKLSKLLGIPSDMPFATKDDNLLQKVFQAIPRAMNDYGACYMVAARYNGVLTVTLLYYCIKNGFDIQSVLASYGWSTVGEMAGAWAAGVLGSGMFYPVNILLSAVLPNVLHNFIDENKKKM